MIGVVPPAGSTGFVTVDFHEPDVGDSFKTLLKTTLFFNQGRGGN
jgi:hypothetical protein